MSSFILVTTALKQTRSNNNPILYLGDWCLDYEEQKNLINKNNYVIQPYHWCDKNKLINDELKLRSIYEKILIYLSNRLNNYHNVNYSLNYWRILLNPFLISLINILFDRWESIRIAYQNYDIKETKVISLNLQELIPFSGQHFKQGVADDDIWNHYVFSLIIKKIGKNIAFINDTENLSILREYKRKTLHLRKKINYNLFINKIIELLLSFFRKKTDSVFINSGLPKFTQLMCNIKLKQLRFNTFKFANYHTGSVANLDIRKKMNKDIPFIKNEFEKFCFENIFNFLPTIYLEDFKKLEDRYSSLKLPKNPKYIFTSTGHLISDEFKYWSAKKIENNSKLIIFQHGNAYGTSKMTTYENHEIKIAEKFLTWGWTSKNNVFPFCNIKTNSKKINYKNDGNCLLITFLASKYFTIGFSSISSSEWLKYHSKSEELYSKLNNKVKDNLEVRLSPNYSNWTSQDKRWKNINPRIKFANKENIEYHYKKSRLCIVDHEGTPFLELMALDIPVILFQPFEPIRDEEMIYFEYLQSVGIFHTKVESASNHINRIWDDVDFWWNSSKTLEAREKFKHRHSRTIKNPSSELMKILKKQIN